MRAKWFVILVVLFTLGLPCRAELRRSIRVAGDEDYPPYEFLDTGGTYKGFNVDIIRAVAIEMSLDIELVPMAWDRAQQALDHGEVDVIQGMTYSDRRAEKFLFSDDLVTNSQVIFVRKDCDTVTELDDLRGQAVAVQSGDIGEEFTRKVTGLRLVPFSNQGQAMTALLDGKVAAFVGNRLTGLYFLQVMNHFKDVKIVGYPLSSTKYCSVALRNNRWALDLIDTGITRLKANKTYDKIYKKWFGETFEDRNVLLKKWLIAAGLLAAAASVLAATVFYWNHSLKKMVQTKTLLLARSNQELLGNQASLEMSNRLRGSILENMMAGIIAFDHQGRILASNLAAHRFFNQAVEPGQTFTDLDIHSAPLALGYESARQGTVWRKELEFPVSAGQVLNVECLASPIKGPDDTLDGVLLILHDQTESKRIKDVLSHDDKMRALGTLAAGIAHELRNPLTAMKAMVDLMPFKFANHDFREQTISIMGQEMQRLNGLVSLLLDYARPRETEPRPFLLDQCVEDILKFFATPLRDRDIQVTFRGCGLTILADAQQVKQAFINLLLNSMDALKGGGTILVSVVREGDLAALRVQDTGCGIPRDALGRIFEPFYTRKANGYGLGLAICYQLVKDNHGTIDFESEVGEGTTATLRFPIPTPVPA